jgi:hypothetical protein
VLQYHFNWKVLSAIACITSWYFYFHPRAPQVVDFLAHLLRHLPGPTAGNLGSLQDSSQPLGRQPCLLAKREWR